MFSQISMQASFGMSGGEILQRAVGMAGGLGISSFTGISGGGAFAGVFGFDRIGFSPDALSGGGSNFFHPLMQAGYGCPGCGVFNGMGMVPGMMPGFGPGGMMDSQMMMMQMLLLMMMQMMQQQGMCGGGMNPMSFGGGFGSPIRMGEPGGSPSFNRPASFNSPVGMLPGGYSRRHNSPETYSSPGSSAASGAPVAFKGGDAGMAKWIDNYLAQKGSPAAGRSAGSMFVKYAKKYNIDPMVLLAISQHETNHGKLGVGMRKMLGVGAYDSNPNGRTKYDGLENQIKYGAITFNNLRRRGGATPNSSIAQQLKAVNRAGWATDKKWHLKVLNHYNRINSIARRQGAFKPAAVNDGGKASPTGSKLADYAAQWNGRHFKRGQTKRCADFVSTMIKKAGVAPKGFRHEVNCLRLQRYGSKVAKKNLKPGDIVFFQNTYMRGKYTHVGIYLGKGKFVHRPTANKPVRIDTLNSGYYAQKYCSARRLP